MSEQELSAGEHERHRRDKQQIRSCEPSVKPKARWHSRHEPTNVDTDEHHVYQYLDQLVHNITKQLQDCDFVLPMLDGVKPPKDRDLLTVVAIGDHLKSAL
jgi:hypothetical protein